MASFWYQFVRFLGNRPFSQQSPILGPLFCQEWNGLNVGTLVAFPWLINVGDL